MCHALRHLRERRRLANAESENVREQLQTRYVRQEGRIVDFARKMEAPPGFETRDGGFADSMGSGIVLTRAGFWSFQLPRLPRCLGRIGLRVDYGAAVFALDHLVAAFQESFRRFSQSATP